MRKKETCRTMWLERSEEAVRKGYFRDPYNSLSVLCKYELSWWSDIGELLDANGVISVGNAQRLLAMLEERDSLFAANIKDESADRRTELIKAADLLKQFLRDAIELDSPIAAWL